MVNSEGPPAAHALGVVRPSPIAGSSSHRAAGVVTSVISGPALPSPADQQAHGHERDASSCYTPRRNLCSPSLRPPVGSAPRRLRLVSDDRHHRPTPARSWHRRDPRRGRQDLPVSPNQFEKLLVPRPPRRNGGHVRARERPVRQPCLPASAGDDIKPTEAPPGQRAGTPRGHHIVYTSDLS